MLRARLQGKVDYGGWNLGRWGVPVNIFALVYSGWMMVIFCFVGCPRRPLSLRVCANTVAACLCPSDRNRNELCVSDLCIRRLSRFGAVVPAGEEDVARVE